MMLALNGGDPVNSEPWPLWPIAADDLVESLTKVIHSGRWAISGMSRGEVPREQRFAERFASFVGARHCIPTTNGSSALMCCLEAAGIGCGDEVIVPGLTWVATATAVLDVNAIPVLVDVDPQSLCLDVEKAEAAVTSRTKAILPVHLYGAMADMDQLSSLADGHDLMLIEDCSHVHGAEWRGSGAGTLGDCGAFSMQQTKLLTSGEGGAVVTNSGRLACRAEQVRADGRVYEDSPSGCTGMVPIGDLLGKNRCLSEFHAAVLLEQLKLLPEQNELRARRAIFLDDLLSSINGVEPQQCPNGVTRRALYCYIARLRPEEFAGRPSEALAAALTAELRFPVERVYPPLNDNLVYCPQTKKRYRISTDHWEALDPRRFALPEARRAYKECVAFHHRLLLAPEGQLSLVGEAIQKVRRLADTIPVVD